MLVVSHPQCETQCGVAPDGDACSFRVAWEINPHMRVGATNSVVALAQHENFVRALRACGERVVSLPFLHGAFDSVFMKDSVILRASNDAVRVLPATARFAERADEPAMRA